MDSIWAGKAILVIEPSCGSLLSIPCKSSFAHSRLDFDRKEYRSYGRSCVLATDLQPKSWLSCSGIQNMIVMAHIQLAWHRLTVLA